MEISFHISPEVGSPVAVAVNGVLLERGDAAVDDVVTLLNSKSVQSAIACAIEASTAALSPAESGVSQPQTQSRPADSDSTESQ